MQESPYLKGPQGAEYLEFCPLKTQAEILLKWLVKRNGSWAEYIFHQISRRFLSFSIYVYCLLSFYPQGCYLVSWDQVQVTAWLQVTQKTCSIIQLNHNLDKSENRWTGAVHPCTFGHIKEGAGIPKLISLEKEGWHSLKDPLTGDSLIILLLII